MTIIECLKFLKKELEKNKIKNPNLEAEIIIEHVLKVDKKYLILNQGKEINKKDLPKIKSILDKRKDNYPWAYIKKERYFYDLKFFVNKYVLIPRPETELIIDNVIKNELDNTTIIDVGTGSGCIIISLANILNTNKKINFYGLDICSKALKIAKYNALQNNLNKKISFYKSNLLEKIIKTNNKQKILIKKNIIITANLPYLTKGEIKNSPTIQAEPQKALIGGKNGLDLYSNLLKQIKKIKSKDNEIKVYMEISPWQKNILIEKIKNILKNIPMEIKTIKDLNKKDRLIKISV